MQRSSAKSSVSNGIAVAVAGALFGGAAIIWPDADATNVGTLPRNNDGKVIVAQLTVTDVAVNVSVSTTSQREGVRVYADDITVRTFYQERITVQPGDVKSIIMQGTLTDVPPDDARQVIECRITLNGRDVGTSPQRKTIRPGERGGIVKCYADVVG